MIATVGATGTNADAETKSSITISGETVTIGGIATTEEIAMTEGTATTVVT